MRYTLGFICMMAVWATLAAGTAPGPQPAGRTRMGIAAPVAMPNELRPSPALLPPPAPTDSVVPAQPDPAYRAGRKQVWVWQILLGLSAVVNAVQMPAAYTSPFFIVLLVLAIAALALGVLLPIILGRTEIGYYGERLLANRAERRYRHATNPNAPQVPGVTAPNAQKAKRKVWWYIGIAVFFGILFLAALTFLILFYDTLGLRIFNWAWVVFGVGAVGFFAATVDAYSWTRHNSFVARKKWAQISQLVSFLFTFLSFPLGLVLSVALNSLLGALAPYVLLITPLSVLLLAILTLVRLFQIRNALRQ